MNKDIDYQLVNHINKSLIISFNSILFILHFFNQFHLVLTLLRSKKNKKIGEVKKELIELN